MIRYTRGVRSNITGAQKALPGEVPHFPLKQLPTRLGEIDKFKDKTVIAVCASGVRSATASGLLKKSGFTDVYSLDGGMTAWQSQGLPTVK